MMARADVERQADWAIRPVQPLSDLELGDLGLYVEESQWVRVRDRQGHRLPSPEEEAARAMQEAQCAAQEAIARREAERRAAEAESELARLRAALAQQTQQEEQ